jgi:hypothetical protein
VVSSFAWFVSSRTWLLMASELCMGVMLMIFSIKPANGPIQSLVRAHLRAARSDGVNSFTVGAGIGHFVMAITLADACDIFANGPRTKKAPPKRGPQSIALRCRVTPPFAELRQMLLVDAIDPGLHVGMTTLEYDREFADQPSRAKPLE